MVMVWLEDRGQPVRPYNSDNPMSKARLEVEAVKRLKGTDLDVCISDSPQTDKDGSFFLALARTKSIASPCQYQIKVGEGGVTHGNVLVEFSFPSHRLRGSLRTHVGELTIGDYQKLEAGTRPLSLDGREVRSILVRDLRGRLTWFMEAFRRVLHPFEILKLHPCFSYRSLKFFPPLLGVGEVFYHVYQRTACSPTRLVRAIVQPKYEPIRRFYQNCADHQDNKVCGNEEGWVWSLDHGTAIESMGISGRSVLGGGGVES